MAGEFRSDTWIRCYARPGHFHRFCSVHYGISLSMVSQPESFTKSGKYYKASDFESWVLQICFSFLDFLSCISVINYALITKNETKIGSLHFLFFAIRLEQDSGEFCLLSQGEC